MPRIKQQSRKEGKAKAQGLQYGASAKPSKAPARRSRRISGAAPKNQGLSDPLILMQEARKTIHNTCTYTKGNLKTKVRKTPAYKNAVKTVCKTSTKTYVCKHKRKLTGGRTVNVKGHCRRRPTS